MRFAWILLFFQISEAQEPKITNLVFEGAGIRGIAYAGAVQALEEKGTLKDVKRVGGTSAGAITALAISLGYNSTDINHIAANTPYKKFNDGRFFFIGGLARMKRYFGWYRGVQFEKWLSRIIRSKTGNADITFAELQQQGYLDLYITGTSLLQQKTVIFSREHFPNMKVRDAVRISMSIPLYFEAAFIDSSGRLVYHPKNLNGLDVMVDGGVLSNYPISLFDSTKYIEPGTTNTFIKNPHTLGFRIDRKEQIAYDSIGKGLAPFDIKRFGDFSDAFYSIILETVNRTPLTKEDWDRTISIDDADIDPRIKKLEKKQIAALVDNGMNATKIYLLR
jgi:NTE family protein